MARTACGTSALSWMYAGTLPAPTPIAGLPDEYAASTSWGPPVARITLVQRWRMSAFVDSIVTFSSQPMQPSGAPAARAASYMIRQLSAMHFTARGCGETTIEQRALSAMRHLKSAVDVGFVVGITAATTPAG